MLTETQELEVLHCVVKHLSVARAARELGLTPSGVSRIVTRLEERLGVRLIHRTTRTLRLTDVGEAFHRRTVQLLSELREAEDEVRATALRPRGVLRMSAPVVFGQRFLVPLLGELLESYPELSVELSLLDRFVDLVHEAIDVAIRIGNLSDSRLIARRLCMNHRVVVASPGYLERRGVPEHPRDLVHHDCTMFTGFSRPREWKLFGPSGSVSINVSGRIASNNIEVLIAAARRDMGLTLGPTLAIGEALAEGELVRVLPEWVFEPTSVFAVYPAALQLSSKVRAAVDFLSTKLRDPPHWDQALADRVPGFEGWVEQKR